MSLREIENKYESAFETEQKLNDTYDRLHLLREAIKGIRDLPSCHNCNVKSQKYADHHEKLIILDHFLVELQVSED